MTTLLCLNPNSRNGEADAEQFAERLRKLGPVEVRTLSKDQTVADWLAELGDAVTRVVVGGGDGTLNAALPALRDRPIDFGVLPLGTANDFARSLGLPDDPLEALEVIVAGHTRRIDVGEINGHLFLNAAGIGLGPELTKRLDVQKKKFLGVFAYLSSLIEVFGQHRRRRATVRVDGEIHRLPFIQVTIANGIFYGGGMKVANDSKLDDGVFDVLCLLPQTPISLVAKALYLRTGHTKEDEDRLVRLYRGTSIEVETNTPADVTADGELLTQTPVKCRMHPGLLNVYCPAPEEMGS